MSRRRTGVGARRWGRRGLLVAGALVATGCAGREAGSADPERAATGSPDPSEAVEPSPEPTRTPLPRARAWQPSPTEIEPTAKLAATREIERRGARQPGVTQVLYPQYGGLEATTASVMAVVARTRRRGDGLRRTVGVVDVRLERAGSGWRVVDYLPAPVRRPGRLDAASRRLVRAGRVDLPAPAVADLRAGTVDPLVVEILLALAEEFTMSVCVFASGHPPTVFGTDGLSNHTRGRAVDVWAVDGRPVVEMALDDPLLIRFLDAARRLGSTEIGGPVVPPGDTGVHFANDLHRDHVHIGFD